jgi:hypothetical protein
VALALALVVVWRQCKLQRYLACLSPDNNNKQPTHDDDKMSIGDTSVTMSEKQLTRHMEPADKLQNYYIKA